MEFVTKLHVNSQEKTLKQILFVAMAKKIYLNHKQRIITARILTIIVGVVFAVSCIGKIGNAGGFAQLIVRYGFPKLSFLAPFIISLEALCALCLLMDIYPRAFSAISGVLLFCFSAAFFYAHTHEGVTDCGCFGNLVENLPPWLTYIRNVLLLVATMASYYLLPKGYSSANATRWIIVALVMAAVIYETGHTYKKAARYKESHPLFQKAIKDTKLAPFLNISKDSTYLLYVFSYECAECIDGLNNVKEYDGSSASDRLILLPVTEDKYSIIHHSFNLNFEEIPVGASLQGEVTAIPVLLYVKNDSIKYVIEGSVPSLFNFNKYYLESR